MSKIQQQCYTRAKRGLFRQSEGYDTTARSPGLSDSFIKDRLHPFCFYHPSRIMQAKRVPAEEFPRAQTVVRFRHHSAQYMLIGQTIYVESDFTGQRSTFFSHNFVLTPPDNFSPAMLNRLNFLTSSDWSELPELDELPFFGPESGLEADKGVDSSGPLPFDESKLRQLAYAVLEATTSSKKVYVVLPGLDWTIPVLMWLYDRLPKAALDILGFTTYSREPINLRYLHLVFMEKGTMIPNDVRLEQDYVFDFDSGYFSANLFAVSEEGLKTQIDYYSTHFDDNLEPEGEPKLQKNGLMKRLKRLLGF